MTINEKLKELDTKLMSLYEHIKAGKKYSEFENFRKGYLKVDELGFVTPEQNDHASLGYFLCSMLETYSKLVQTNSENYDVRGEMKSIEKLVNSQI